MLNELETLAIQIYETRYEYLTPLQKRELDNHIIAKKKLEEVSQSDEVKQLIKNTLTIKAKKDTKT